MPCGPCGGGKKKTQITRGKACPLCGSNLNKQIRYNSKIKRSTTYFTCSNRRCNYKSK